MKGNLWTLLIVIVLAAVLLPAAGYGYQHSTYTYDVEAEEIAILTSDPAAVEYADEAASFSDDVEVRHNESALVDGQDYDWSHESGELLALDEQYDGEIVEIDYTYDAHDETTVDVANVIGTFDVAWPLLVLVVAVAAVLGLTFAAWGGGGFGGR